MADAPNQQEAIVQEIIINLQNNGFAATAKNINSVKSLLSQLIAQDRNLAKSQNDLSKAVEKSTKLFTTMQSQVERSSKVVNKLSSIASNSLRSVTRMFADAFSGKVSSNGLQTLEKYNASLLKMSGLAKAFGGGMGNVQRSIEKLNRTTSLTKQSSSELFELYSNTMPTVSVGNFEKSMIRLSKATGGNVEIMKELIQTLGGLVEKYPALENAVVNLNSKNAEYLKNNITLLQLTGKISLAEYKRYSSAIALAGGYATAEEKQIAKTQEVFSNLKKQSERLALGAGKIFLPFVEKIASFVEQNGERISAFMDKIAEMGKGLIGFFSPLVGILSQVGSFISKHSTLFKVAGIAGGALLAGNKIKNLIMPRGSKSNPMYVKNADGLGEVSDAASAIKEGKGIASLASWGGKMFPMMAKMLPLLTNPIVIGAAVGIGAGYGIDYLMHGKEDAKRKKDMEENSLAFSKNEEKRKKQVGADSYNYAYAGDAMDKLDLNEGSNIYLKDYMQRMRTQMKAGIESRVASGERASGTSLVETSMPEESVGELNKKIKDKKDELKEREERLKEKQRGDITYQQYSLAKEDEKKYEKELDKYGGMEEIRNMSFSEQLQVPQDLIKMYETAKQIAAETKYSLDPSFISDLEEVEKIQGEIAANEDKRAVAQEKQRKLSQSQEALYQSQSGYLSTIVNQANLTGQIDREKVHNEYIYTKELLQKSIDSKKVLLATAQAELNNAIELGATEQVINDFKEETLRLSKGIASETEQMVADQKSLFNLYDTQLKNLSLQSAQTKSLISLAQNYAIGVGSSMNLQLKSFQASQKEIDMMNQKLSAINAEIASGAGNQLDLNNQRLDLENQIYQKQLDQASTVKSLRDGWVSAVGAMNTGAGAFSKIVMSQEKNTGSMLSMLGNKAVLTSMSGAMGRGMGYGKSEKLTIGGQIAGAHKGLAYETQADKLMGGQGGVRALEMGQRDYLMKSMENQTKQTMSKGGGALVFASDQMKSAAVEAGTMGYDASGLSASAGQNLNLPSVNVHIEVKDLDKLAQKISEKMGPALEQMASSIASKLTGGIR